jgi:hypothetical protein
MTGTPKYEWQAVKLIGENWSDAGILGKGTNITASQLGLHIANNLAHWAAQCEPTRQEQKEGYRPTLAINIQQIS